MKSSNQQVHQESSAAEEAPEIVLIDDGAYGVCDINGYCA